MRSEEFHDLFTSPRKNKSRTVRWPGHVACIEETRNAHRDLVDKTERNRKLGRSRSRWEEYVINC
jgi:hypothetical protein